MAKSLSLSLSLSLSFSPSPSSSSFSLLATGSGSDEAEKAKQDGGKWPGEPKTSPSSPYLFTTGGAPTATAQIYRIQCGRFCYH